MHVLCVSRGVCVCVYVCVDILCAHVCGGHRTVFRSCFSPFNMWVLGISLRWPGLVVTELVLFSYFHNQLEKCQTFPVNAYKLIALEMSTHLWNWSLFWIYVSSIPKAPWSHVLLLWKSVLSIHLVTNDSISSFFQDWIILYYTKLYFFWSFF